MSFYRTCLIFYQLSESVFKDVGRISAKEDPKEQNENIKSEQPKTIKQETRY